MTISSEFMDHINDIAPFQLSIFQKFKECCSPKRKKYWSYSGLQDKLIYASPERIPSMIEEYIINILRNHFWDINDPTTIEMGKIWDYYCNTIYNKQIIY